MVNSQFLDEMAKEKAEILFHKFFKVCIKWDDAVKATLICVDEMIDCCSDIYDREFMEKVKTQLEKL